MSTVIKGGSLITKDSTGEEGTSYTSSFFVQFFVL